MTISPLSQRRYAVNAFVADIGWITDQEKKDVEAVIEGGDVRYTSELKELHLYWAIPADTMTDALDQARATLRAAAEAPAVHVPRTRKFDVCEIG